MKIVLVALALVALAAPPAAAQTTWRFIVPVVVSQISSSVTGGFVRCEVGPTNGSSLRISDTTHFAIDQTGAFSGDLTVEIVTTDPTWPPGVGERQACYLYLIGPSTTGTTSTAEIPSETALRAWARPNTANPFDAVWVRNLP